MNGVRRLMAASGGGRNEAHGVGFASALQARGFMV
jgi:hypothetical protein